AGPSGACGGAPQRGRQRASFTAIVAADAFESEVEAVRDARVEPPCTIDCGSAINAIAGKDDRAADRIAEIRRQRFRRNLFQNLGGAALQPCRDRITGQSESPET